MIVIALMVCTRAATDSLKFAADSPMDVDGGATGDDKDAETTLGTEPDTTKTLEMLEQTEAAALQQASKKDRPRRKSTRNKVKTPDDACECGASCPRRPWTGDTQTDATDCSQGTRMRTVA